MRPANGSAVVLKTNAEGVPPPEIFCVPSLPPMIAATPSRSVGAGRFSTMKLRIRSLPILCSAGGAEDRENSHFGDSLLEAFDNLLDLQRALCQRTVP